MNFPRIVIAISLIIGLTTCSKKQQKYPDKVEQFPQTHLLMATLYMQQSAEYKALCMQTYSMAFQSLLSQLKGKPTMPAIVLDIDETILDNSPYTAWQIVNHQNYTPQTWKNWSSLSEAEAIPGAVEFLHKADSLGVYLWFISNRSQDELKATIANMLKLGIPQATPEHYMLKTNTSEKTARRDSVLKLGYTVLLYIGDNLADFEGIWDYGSNAERTEAVESRNSMLGKKYFLLPNPVYGTWEGAMYRYRRDFSHFQLDSIRMNLLRLPSKDLSIGASL